MLPDSKYMQHDLVHVHRQPADRHAASKPRPPSREPSNDSGISSSKVAWMSFQRLRSNQACAPHHYTPVQTARSWPECRPAGMSTIEQDFREHQAVSSARPRPRNLPPLNPKKGVPRGSSSKNHEASSNKDWAKTWARQRAGQTSIQVTGTDIADKYDRTDKNRNQRPFGVSNRKREVVVLNEKDAAALKRVKGIYANSKDKGLRDERIKTTLRSLHQKTMHAEINNSMKEYKKKLEQDKLNREELERVRRRHTKEKKRRERVSYVSLNAFDAPQVARKSFGLPDEGEELHQNSLATGQKTEKKLKEIWTRTMKRAAMIEHFLNLSSKNSAEAGEFPEIRVRERRPSIIEKDHSEDIEADNLARDRLKVDFMLSEIDTISAVDLEEEDRLSDLNEEEDEYT